MKTITALLIACLSVLGLSACKMTYEPAQPSQEAKPSVQTVEPKGKPLDPPTVVTAPLAEVKTERVTIESSPALPAQATALDEATALLQNITATPSIPALPVIQAQAQAQAQLPVWSAEDRAIPSQVWDTRATQATVPAQQAPAVQAPRQATVNPVPTAQRVDPQCEESGYKTVNWTCVDPYSGNPIVDCEAQGLVRAEDYTCVKPNFWDGDKGDRKHKDTKNSFGRTFDTGGNSVR